MVNIMAAVVLIPIALILVAAIGGVAFNLFFSINTSQPINASNLSEGFVFQWEPATITVWNLVPIIALIVIFLALLAVVGLKITGKL